MASSETTPADTCNVKFDPFTFLAGSASRIVGLGGSEPPSDSAYAFHTPYGSLKSGLTTFLIRFQGLRASVGNLTLLINAMSPLAGSVARTVKMCAHPLRDIAMTGEVQVTINTKSHLNYAVLGFVYGPTNASAEALVIEAHQAEENSITAPTEHEIVYSEFGDANLRQMPLLASSIPATLASPVSQTPTIAQYQEPAFTRWGRLLDRPRGTDEETWARVYVLSTIDCYGMMTEGASGFGVCTEGESVHSILLSSGCASTLLSNGTAIISPNELSNQDFSWSIDAVPTSIMDAPGWITTMLEPLKIGGISVHVMRYDATHSGGNWRNHGEFLTRSDLDRLILGFLAASHDVAQLKIDRELSAQHPTRVGIIIRKGQSTFY